MERAFHGIRQFGPRPLRILGGGQFLMHAFFSETMDECPLLIGKMPAHHGQVSPNRCMRQKLPDQGIAIEVSLRKQQDSRSETVDSMHSKDPLPTAGKVLYE